MATWRTASGAVVLLALTTGGSAFAQAPEPAQPDVTALAKTTQNPVGDLISVPLQFNFNTGGGLDGQTFLNLNVQPVIPFQVSANWKAIARTIVPLNSLPGPDNTRYSGVGDIQEQLFFTPDKPGAIIWGVGPVFSLPTATSAAFSTGTWAVGAGGVVLKDAGPFVLGGVVSQFWPLSDSGDEIETNLLTMQPFVNYNFGQGWALSMGPVISANWDAADGQQWTVPLGFGITRTTIFNKQPMNIGVQVPLQRRAA